MLKRQVFFLFRMLLNWKDGTQKFPKRTETSAPGRSGFNRVERRMTRMGVGVDIEF